MKPRYILAPEAARDLIDIWLYIREKAGIKMADRVESVIRGQMVFLSETPGAGHWRRDLTGAPVKFAAVYSWLIVYRPKTKPLQVVAILHGHRDVERVLTERF